MALIVEDGSGKSDAESFVSVAEITSYAAKWGLVFPGSADPEVCARKGTRYLEATYAKRITGSRGVLNQALSWPRIYAEDTEFDMYPPDNWGIGGNLVPSTIVPQAWKDAACEMSIAAVSGEILPDVTGSDRLKSKDVQVGPIRKSVEYDPSSTPIAWVRRVDLLVGRFLQSGATVRRA